MDFPMCSIECIPTFLCAVLNGHNVNAKIVYNQLLLIFARLLTGEKKIDSKKVLHALIRTCCCAKNLYILSCTKKIVVSLFFLVLLENPLEVCFYISCMSKLQHQFS